MTAHLGSDICLEDLARIAGLSAPHFSRAFKQSTGVPPFAWRLQRRIERAKELLADHRLALADIALAVGFSAQPQFTTAFRRVAGMTPGAWRRVSR
jgi:AraC family transcriptional regulator